MELKIKQYGFTDFYIRNNKSDDWVINEVLRPSTYQKALDINKNDIVLDLGLNIAAFSVLWGYKAQKCFAYEPDEENFTIAKKNIELNKIKNCYIYNKAIVGSNINDVLKKTKANKLKIDIEGAEYEVLKAIKNWDQIDAIIFEWHKNFLKDNNNIKLKEIEKIIKSNFKNTLGNFNTKGWMNIISAKK